MSTHVCRKCRRQDALFGEGGSAAMARELGIPMLGSLPLVRELREGGDRGLPLVVSEPEHPQSLAFLEIARRVDQALDQAPVRAGPPILH